MPSLNLKEIYFQNFRSYGNYMTTIKLDGLGPVLIIGENKDNPDYSNGVGKSTIAEALVWILWGRFPGNKTYLMTPGDHVINEKTGKDCVAGLVTTDGWTIERTRKYQGHDDLLVKGPNGQDVTLSTSKNAQQFINEQFKLDFDIFLSNIFFAQSGQPFLELPDLKRKKALERMLHLDRFDEYAQVAKEKMEAALKQQDKHKADLEHADRDILSVSQKVEKNTNLQNNYEVYRQKKIVDVRSRIDQLDQKYQFRESTLLTQIKNIEADKQKMESFDIDNLKKKWETYNSNIAVINQIEQSFQKLSNEIMKLTVEQRTIEAEQTPADLSVQLIKLDEQISTTRRAVNNIIIIDIDTLKENWRIHDITEESLSPLLDQYQTLENKINVMMAEYNTEDADIVRRQKAAGTVCGECGQPVSKDHIQFSLSSRVLRLEQKKELIVKAKSAMLTLEEKINEIEDKIKDQLPEITLEEAHRSNSRFEQENKHLESLELHRDTLVEQQTLAKNNINIRAGKLKQLAMLIDGKTKVLTDKRAKLALKKAEIEASKPNTTVNDVQLLKQQYDHKQTEIENIQKQISQLGHDKQQEKVVIEQDIHKVEIEPNPYHAVIEDLQNDLKKAKDQRAQIADTITKFDTVVKHVNYIYKAYADRRKIKAFIMAKLIPYFNERIAYYLDVFECRCVLKFNSFLQFETDKWPYELWSGGQRRRIDLAVMFAIHDLHESIYGRQCNILVFDEYDKSLDKAGLYAFVNLLFKDFVDKDLTILIISHNDAMKDMFPTKILVKMEDDLSKIEEIR